MLQCDTRIHATTARRESPPLGDEKEFRGSDHFTPLSWIPHKKPALLLTGFRDNFVKIRVDWSQAHQQTAADADAALQAFVPALMR